MTTVHGMTKLVSVAVTDDVVGVLGEYVTVASGADQR